MPVSEGGSTSSNSSTRMTLNANLGWDDHSIHVSLSSLLVWDENSTTARESCYTTAQPWGCTKYSKQTGQEPSCCALKSTLTVSRRLLCLPSMQQGYLLRQASDGWLYVRTSWCPGCLWLSRLARDHRISSFRLNCGLMVLSAFSSSFPISFHADVPLIISLHF